MPTPMPTWNVSTRAPRRLGGASSATYIGTVCVAPPTANPRTIRDSESSSGVGDSEDASVPTTKMSEMINRVRLRPSTSERRLQDSAPMIAPSRMLAAMTDSHPVPMWNW